MRTLTVVELLILENIFTIIITGTVICVIAKSTGSLHCLWGLLILLNMNSYKTIMASDLNFRESNKEK